MIFYKLDLFYFLNFEQKDKSELFRLYEGIFYKKRFSIEVKIVY